MEDAYTKFGKLAWIVKLYDDANHFFWCIGIAAILLMKGKIKEANEMWYWTIFHLTHKGTCIKRPTFKLENVFPSIVGLLVFIGLITFVKVVFSTFEQWIH